MKITPRKIQLVLFTLSLLLSLSNSVFAANQPPSVGTIAPSSGSSNPNDTVTFTTTFTDPDGWQNIKYVQFLICYGAGGFLGHYNLSTNKVSMMADDRLSWLASYTPGSANIIENSYVKLNCANTTVSGQGTTLTVKWSLTFKPKFTGTKNMSLKVVDKANASNGFTQKGTWTIGNQPPLVGTITPSSGNSAANDTVIFTTTFTDPDGWQNIKYVQFLICYGAGGFLGHYNLSTNKVSMMADDRLSWLTSYTPGSANTIENSYVKLNCANTTVSGQGTTLTIKWSIIFKPIFTGTKNMSLKVVDNANAYEGFTQKGTWTIKAPLPQNPSISILEGLTTNHRDIHLVLHADNANEMIISENLGFNNASWEPYNVAKLFYLSIGLGPKKVYVKFRNITNDETNPVNAVITLIAPLNTVVEVVGRQLVVNYEPYIIKGVTYQPTPVGYTPENPGDRRFIYNANNCDRDFKLLKDMGCNTIRTYSEATQVLLDKAQQYGIKVCAGFWVDYALDLGDPIVRQDLINRFSAYVNSFKSHSALLMWAIGNENNYQNGNNADCYSLANEMAKAAKNIEGANYHPAALVNGDLFNIGDINKAADDNSLEYIDIWATNTYVGYSFNYHNYFQRYEPLSDKPLWISECGIDAYDNEHNQENQKRQSAWDRHNWDEISESNVCVGATFMSYSDEWWKDGLWKLFTHEPSGYSASLFPYKDSFPDKYSNEEWWGFMAINGNGGANDTMIPRSVYYSLRKRWLKMQEALLVDDYNDNIHNQNSLGANSGIFGTCSYDNIIDAQQGKCLSLSYDVALQGSFGGYYTLANNADTRRYDCLTFKVKGLIGGEMFKVGIKDKNDEAKINAVEYIPQGVTINWQNVRIPITTFGNNVDFNEIGNISFAFENADGSVKSTLFIDDLKFETGLPELIVDNFDYYSELKGQNALGITPWTDKSGGSTITYDYGINYGDNNTQGLHIAYKVVGGAYCRWAERLNRIDISSYKNISINVKGADGDEEFNLYLQDVWGNRYSAAVTGITPFWQTIEIPVEDFAYKCKNNDFAQFTGVDITSVINLEIVFEWKNTQVEKNIYIDDIQFTN